MLCRVVSIHNSFVPYELLAAILQAPELKRLTLIDCEFSVSPETLFNRLPPTLPLLKHVSFERSRIEGKSSRLLIDYPGKEPQRVNIFGAFRRGSSPNRFETTQCC